MSQEQRRRRDNRFQVRLRAYFQTHRTGIRLAAFLILFLTFIAREGVRDYLKDKLTTISNARANELMLTQISNLHFDAAMTQGAVSAVQSGINGATVGLAPSRASARITLNAISEKNSNAIYSLFSIADLATVIHLDENTISMKKKIDIDMGNNVDSLGELSRRMDAGELLGQTELHTLDSAVNLTMASTIKLERYVDDTAVGLKKRLETELTAATVVAFIFYGLGVILNGFAIWFGSSDMAAD
jgi:hypothetical protein